MERSSGASPDDWGTPGRGTVSPVDVRSRRCLNLAYDFGLRTVEVNYRDGVRLRVSGNRALSVANNTLLSFAETAICALAPSGADSKRARTVAIAAPRGTWRDP
jgi:hypothetical protein